MVLSSNAAEERVFRLAIDHRVEASGVCHKQILHSHVELVQGAGR